MAVHGNRVTMIRRSEDQAGALLPVPGWRSAAWNVPLLGGTVITLIAAALTWPVAAAVRRRYEIALPEAERTWARRLTMVVVAIDLAFIAGWLALLAQLATGHAEVFVPGLDRWIRLLQLVGVLGAVGAAAGVWHAAEAWSQSGRWMPKLARSALALAAIAIGWFSFAFHLITPRVRY
jgi:hypothetical protein